MTNNTKNTISASQNIEVDEADKASPLSKEPAKAMQDMMDTIDMISAVLAEENDALIKADTKLFSTLQDKKIAASKIYQYRSEQFISRSEELKNVSPDINKKFEERYKAFSDIAQENIAQLQRMNSGVERLQHHIMKAARKSVDKEGVNYSAGGQMKSCTKSASMGLNKSA